MTKKETGYEKTRWGEKDFSKGFLEKAEGFIPERRRLIEVALSYCSHFKGKDSPRLVDLGCGDAIMTAEFFKNFGECEAVLVDASADMIAAAKKRLKESGSVTYIQKTFEEMIDEDLLEGDFNVALSSLAIHHMKAPEKRALYSYIYERLSCGGLFVNIDTVLSPTDRLEEWYLRLWLDWIEKEGTVTEEFASIPKHYKENPGNTPDQLAEQLEVLRDVGFVDVDCFFKYGIFTVFGGRKV